MAHNKTFISWLQNAYAMEMDIVNTLKSHAEQAESFPEIAEKIREHITASEGHAEKVKGILNGMDEDVSGVKSALGQMMGAMKGPSTALADDRVIKNSIMEYATEHFEIASYTAIMTAAENLGHDEIIQMCEEILQDEEEMAEWLETNLPPLTSKYLSSKQEEG